MKLERRLGTKSLLILYILLLSVFTFMFKAGLENYLSPDETVYKFFIDNFRETNNLYSEEDLNVKSIDIFHPRNAYTNGDKVFPTGFIGIIFTYGLFSYFSNLNLVTTIIFLLGVFYVYKLSTLFFKQKTSITVSLLYSISPIILLFSLRIYYNNMPAFVFFLIGAYYYLRDTSYKDFFLTGVFWSLAIFFRNTYIVFIFVSVVLYFLITLRKEHIFEKFLKHIIIGIFVFFSVLQIFLINTLIFGSALENQYSNNDDLEGSSLLGKIGWFFMTSGFDPQRLYSNFTDYIVKFFFPLSLFIVISSIYCFKKRKNLEPKSSTKLIFIFIYLTYKIIFYYTGVYYGMSFADLTLSSSYLRYIPEISLLIIFSFYGLLGHLRSKYLQVTLIFVSVIFLINLGLTANEGILKVYSINKAYGDVKEDFLNIVPPENSIIYTKYWDKVLFPTYQVATSSKDKTISDNMDEIAKSMIVVHKEGKKVYLLANKNFYNIEEINEYLNKEGLILKKKNNMYGGLYELQTLT